MFLKDGYVGVFCELLNFQIISPSVTPKLTDWSLVSIHVKSPTRSQILWLLIFNILRLCHVIILIIMYFEIICSFYLGNRVCINTVWFYIVFRWWYILVFTWFQWVSLLLNFKMDNLQLSEARISNSIIPSLQAIATSASSSQSNQFFDKTGEKNLRDIVGMLVCQMNRMENSIASMR